MLTQAITASGQTRRAIADQLGISASYLSLLEGGKKRPSLDLAFRIERLTGGAVPAASWTQVQEDAA